MSEEEEWRPIEGWDGYLVSNLGRVMSLPKACRPRSMILALRVGRKGYTTVQLWDGEKNRSIMMPVHRIVTRAFLGPRPEGLEVRHLNGNRLDPRLSNLVYGTRSENQRDRRGHGTDFNANKTHCPRKHPYDEMNTYYTPKHGKRQCRTCRAEASRRSEERRRAGLAA